VFPRLAVLYAECDVLSWLASDDLMDLCISQRAKSWSCLPPIARCGYQGGENEAALLEGIESLRVEKSRLLAIDLGSIGLRLVKLDQHAIEQVNPIRPCKTLVCLQ